MKTYPLFRPGVFWHSAWCMFLRSTNANEGWQRASLLQHRGEPPVASEKWRSGRVLYLGEINDSQQAAWRKTLEVFDEEKQQFTS